MNIDAEQLREAQLEARQATPATLREQTKDARMWFANVAQQELARRDRENSDRESLTGVVEPL
jgi:hypothetical protein